MRPKRDDRAYLWDMLDAAKTVRQMCAGMTFHEYQNNRMLQLAVERSVEIIGEAARHVSKTFQESQPRIPWKGIIGQRHMLAHEYGEIKQERIWRVATFHVPELIQLLEECVPDLE